VGPAPQEVPPDVCEEQLPAAQKQSAVSGSAGWEGRKLVNHYVLPTAQQEQLSLHHNHSSSAP
jgi:hypothetical protein